MSSDAHIGQLLVAARRRFETELTEELNTRGYGDITLAHSALFAHLDPAGTRPTELARRAGTTKQSMGELVADLERKGYVERAPDPADGRASLVRLTPAGRRLARAAQEAIGDLERRYRARLGREGLNALRRGLEEMAAPRT